LPISRLCQPSPRRRRRPAPDAALLRLADLVNTIDPKLAAAAFGMNPESVTFYLAVTSPLLPANG
jgi:hypothetical protein